MKYLGIDYGTKRIGVAVSDDTGTLAFPLGLVASGEGALEEVLELARENGVETVVMGESRNFKGEANPLMEKIEKFKVALEAAGKKVILEPEYMTSAAAEHQHTHSHDAHTGRPTRKEAVSKEFLDSSAAALILQSFLDRRKQQTDVE
jgi:putative Holliday junction resolvase